MELLGESNAPSETLKAGELKRRILSAATIPIALYFAKDVQNSTRDDLMYSACLLLFERRASWARSLRSAPARLSSMPHFVAFVRCRFLFSCLYVRCVGFSTFVSLLRRPWLFDRSGSTSGLPHVRARALPRTAASLLSRFVLSSPSALRLSESSVSGLIDRAINELGVPIYKSPSAMRGAGHRSSRLVLDI